MDNKFFILLAMIFLHIIDDYKLQGILASMKQKTWWKGQKGYKELYKYDYIIALIEHAFSWSFMITLPIVIFLNPDIVLLIVTFTLNVFTHAFIDSLKANALKINLVTDQLIHILQIIVTWLIFILI